MKNIKRLLFVATLLLALVGGAGQASADPGNGGTGTTITITVDPAGATWEGAGFMLSAGATWE